MSIINPPLTIASVNTGTDELTFAAPHGLVTGDPFLVVYSPDGGTLPAPLAPVTHYWCIRKSDTVISLSTSSTNAMAGIAINLTTAGSGGTFQVLRGLPYSIPAILVPFTQLDPDHVQSAFESIEALWALLTGQTQGIFSGVTLASNQHLAVLEDRVLTIGAHLALVTSGTPSFALSNINFAGNGSMAYGIPLRVGDVIKSYVLYVGGDGTVDVTLQFVKFTPSTNAQVIVDTTTVNNVPSNSPSFAFNALSVNPADQVIGPNDVFMVNVSWTGVTGNVFLSSLKVTYSSP